MMNSGDDVGTDEVFSHWFREKRARETGRSDSKLLLFVTYYSDPRDRVPHTPEVCYRQGSATVQNMRTIAVERPAAMAGTGPLAARLIDVSQPGVELAVMYLIYCNGKVYHDREQVRWSIGMPGDAYTYFSKVEVVVRVMSDAEYDERIEQAVLLLKEGLQQLITTHYPSDAALQRKPGAS